MVCGYVFLRMPLLSSLAMSDNRLLELLASDWGRPVEADQDAVVLPPPSLRVWRRPSVRASALVGTLVVLAGALAWQLAPLLFQGTPLAAQSAERRLGYVVSHQPMGPDRMLLSVQDDDVVRWVVVSGNLPWHLGARVLAQCHSGATYLRLQGTTGSAPVLSNTDDESLCPVSW